MRSPFRTSSGTLKLIRTGWGPSTAVRQPTSVEASSSDEQSRVTGKGAFGDNLDSGQNSDGRGSAT